MNPHLSPALRQAVAVVAVGAAFLALPLHAGPKKKKPKIADKPELSIVRVNVTGQSYDFFRPWQKQSPFSKRALGAVMPHNRILVTAELVANWTFIELEKAESDEKVSATVEVVDYEANLALLKPSNEKFLADMPPAEMAADVTVGDRLYVFQLEASNVPLVTAGTITTVEVARYPVETTSLLTYRLSISLQYRESSFTLPVASGPNKFAGLLMRYDPRTSIADVLPAPVIAHFLKDAESGDYKGFPSVGISYTKARDPQLRRFADLNGNANRGVYVTNVLKNGPADRAGIKQGDVIVQVGDHEVDADGNYVDPLFGKTEITHLLSTKSHVGEKVPIKILREGKPVTADLTLTHRDLSGYVSEPFVVDRAPKFYVLGGLVFEELSRQYLRQWGADWRKRAPLRLQYIDEYQSELFEDKPGRKVIILTQVLPTASTIGYEDVRNAVVTKINGKDLTSLNDIPKALANPVNGFHKIELEEDPRVLYLDAGQTEANDAALQRLYGLPSMRQLD